MRRANETGCSLLAFYRHLKTVGISVKGRAEPLLYTQSYGALRSYIIEVLGFSWPRSTGATGIQAEDRSR